MSTSIKERLSADMKSAMRNSDKEKLGTIRLMLAAIKQREIDERIMLDDEQVMAILNKMIKQRRDSITQFTAGNRTDLADRETQEIVVIKDYLPLQMSEIEIEHAVAEAIQSTGASKSSDMGKVMGVLKAKLQGKADMTVVSTKVKVRLAETE